MRVFALSPNVKISWFVVPTKDRPGNLYKCLSSYIKNTKAFSRDVSVLVSDDSVLSESVRENRNVIAAIRRKFGVKIYYNGLDEKKQIAKALAHQVGVSHSLTEFAILGYQNGMATYGANRNSIVLATLGHCVFSADDDTLCYLKSSLSQNADVNSTIGDSLPHQFFKSRKEAIRSVNRIHTDLLGAHESYLGRGVTGLLHSESVQSDPMSESLHGNIKIVSNGIVGDSGYLSASAIALSVGTSAAPQLDTEINYRRCMTSREVVRQVGNLQIGPAHKFMATAYSFINDGSLPPFFPNCRNEDGVLAYFVSISMPEVHIANLPLSIVHAANLNRKYSNSSFQFRFSELLIAVFRHWAIRNDNPKENLANFGQFLVDTANLSKQELSATLGDIITDLMRAKIDYLLSLLSLNKFFPEYWAEDMRRQILFIECFIADRVSFFFTNHWDA